MAPSDSAMVIWVLGDRPTGSGTGVLLGGTLCSNGIGTGANLGGILRTRRFRRRRLIVFR